MDDPIRFLLRGCWTADRVKTRLVPSSRRVVPEVESAIDAAWRETNARPGVKLFDGPVCRLEKFDVRLDGLLRIDLSPTSYRVNVGTNFVNPQLADRFGAEVMANPLGVSAGLITRDGFLVLGRRNGSVAYYPHRLHPFAGSIELRDDVDLFDDCRRELREEIGLGANAIESIELIGLVEDPLLKHPEAIFRVRTSWTRDEVQARVDPTEHGSSEAWSLAVEELQSLARRADATPVARSVAMRLIELL